MQHYECRVTCDAHDGWHRGVETNDECRVSRVVQCRVASSGKPWTHYAVTAIDR